MGAAALAACAFMAPAPAAAQMYHGGMHGGGMHGGMMHQWHGGGFRGGFGPGFHRDFRRFRGRGFVGVFPAWGWGWGWAPDVYYAPPYCSSWWWDGWGWRCAW